MTTAEIQVVRDAEALELQFLKAGDTEGAAALRLLIDGYLDEMRAKGKVIIARPTQVATAALFLAALFA